MPDMESSILDSSTNFDSSKILAKQSTLPAGSQRRMRVKGAPPSFRQPHTDTVVVRVGKSKVPFTAHKAFLIHYSPYFEAAFTGNFEEASTGIVDLEHTTPEVFGLCLEWIMTQQIHETHITPEQSRLSVKKKCEIESPRFGEMTRLWLLADYLGIPKLQNKSIDMIISKRARLQFLPSAYLPLVFEESMPGSSIRKWFADCCCWSGALDHQLEKYPHNFPAEMLRDLALAQSRRVKNPSMPDPRLDRKRYYVATEGYDERCSSEFNSSSESENSDAPITQNKRVRLTIRCA